MVTRKSLLGANSGRASLTRAAALFCALAALLGGATEARARSAGEPIVLRFEEGDVGGLQTVWAENSERAIGTVEYRQWREKDLLHTLRISRFSDGSNDEDLAVARIVDGRLEAQHGHQIQRDARGNTILEVTIDVVGDRVSASWGPPDDRQSMDESVELPPGTYWGPLVFLVLKNFEANAENDRVVFRTVAPTPRPRVLDLELVQGGTDALERPGLKLMAQRYSLQPTFHWSVDPIIALLVPNTSFWTVPGKPPGLALFEGPRNYQRERIMLR